MVADATDETAALNKDVDMGGHEEFDAAAEGVNVNLLVLGDDGLAQVHADATAESIETSTVERLTAIDVLVAAVVNRAADALAVLADGQRALQPLIGVAAVTVNDSSRANVARSARLTLLRPGRTLRVYGVDCLCERGLCFAFSVSVRCFFRAFRVSKVARRICDFLSAMRYKVRKRAGITFGWFWCWCWCRVRETPFY